MQSPRDTSMVLTIDSKLRLNNGVEIPVLGFGTLHMQGEVVQKAIQWALDAGYRHIDTAKAYGNESDVGIAIRRSGLKREELFVTTKLWNEDHGYDNTLNALNRSLKNLGMSYVDLYLIHWPVSGRRQETWKAMQRVLGEGKARSIGVSNFTKRHLEELQSNAGTVPVVNQVEFTPFLYQKALQQYCETNGTRIEAWAPLTRGKRFDNPVVADIAIRHGKTPAQILLRWSLQHSVIVLPKSSNQERIAENAAIFDFNISDEEMAKLDGLNEDLRTSGWDPESDQFK